jgi:hypothetical protein
MGIAGVEPRQLAPTVGTTGSRSTDSPAPSSTTANLTASTRFDGSSSAIAVDSASSFDIDPLTINFYTNNKIDINSAINTAVSIAVLAIIDTNPSKTEVDVTGSTVIDTASPSAADLTPAAIIIDPTSGTAGAVSAVTRGFDMAFGLFNFHVDNDGVAELISISDSTPPAAAPSASPVIKGNPSTTIPLAPSEEEPRLETLTPSVGSNYFEDPPPSPTTEPYASRRMIHKRWPDASGTNTEFMMAGSSATQILCDTPNLQQIQSAHYVFHHNSRIIVVTYIT